MNGTGLWPVVVQIDAGGPHVQRLFSGRSQGSNVGGERISHLPGGSDFRLKPVFLGRPKINKGEADLGPSLPCCWIGLVLVGWQIVLHQDRREFVVGGRDGVEILADLGCL